MGNHNWTSTVTMLVKGVFHHLVLQLHKVGGLAKDTSQICYRIVKLCAAETEILRDLQSLVWL